MNNVTLPFLIQFLDQAVFPSRNQSLIPTSYDSPKQSCNYITSYHYINLLKNHTTLPALIITPSRSVLNTPLSPRTPVGTPATKPTRSDEPVFPGKMSQQTPDDHHVSRPEVNITTQKLATSTKSLCNIFEIETFEENSESDEEIDATSETDLVLSHHYSIFEALYEDFENVVETSGTTTDALLVGLEVESLFWLAPVNSIFTLAVLTICRWKI